MTRYRKIEVPMWTDRRFRSLSAAPPNAQTLWMYLLSGPRTTVFPGLVVANPAIIALDLGWPVDRQLDIGDASPMASGTRVRCVRDAWQEIADHGMARADFKAGLIVLTKALFTSENTYRDSAKPSSANQLVGWEKAWPDIPECPLKDEYLRELQRFANACSKPLGAAFSRAFDRHLRILDASTDARVDAKATRPGSGTGSGTGDLRSRRALSRARETTSQDDAVKPSGDPTTASKPDAEPEPLPPPDNVVPLVFGAEARAGARVAVGHVDADPALIARRALGDRAWERLNRERAALAAELGIEPPRHLHPQLPGRTWLADRLRESGDHAEADLEHVFAVTLAEARAPHMRSYRYLSASMFTPESWQAKLGMEIADAAQPSRRGASARGDSVAGSRATAPHARMTAFDAVDQATAAITRAVDRREPASSPAAPIADDDSDDERHHEPAMGAP